MAKETFKIEIPIEAEDKTSPGVDKATKKMNGFDKTNEKVQARLRKMNKEQTKVNIEAKDKVSSVLSKISRSIKSVTSKVWSFNINAIDKASRTIALLKGEAKSFASRTWKTTLGVIDKFTSPLSKLKNMLFSVNSLIATVATGLATKLVVAKPVNYADNIENAQIAFESLLGSGGKAKKMMSDLMLFARDTPFDTAGVVDGAKQMHVYGIEAKNVLSYMEKIGNTAAALGSGEAGIDAITRAIGQMKAKNKVSAQEMLQLTEAGVKAWDYLAKGAGVSVARVQEMTEDGLIPANDAIKYIIAGMGEFDGLMNKASNRTVKGLASNIKDTLQQSLVLKWGTGLQKGAVKGLRNMKEWLDRIDPMLKEAGTSLERLGEIASTRVFDFIKGVTGKVELTLNTDKFKKANLGGKIKILWNDVIYKPFVEWWENSGKPKLTVKVGEFGSTLGSGITNGLLALLGFDIDGAKEDGKNVGTSFINGFKEGFDTEKISDALSQWASDNKEIVAGFGIVLGVKLISGISKAVKNGKSLYDSLASIFSKGSKSTEPEGSQPHSTSQPIDTMNVKANVVNVYGGQVNNIPSSTPSSLPSLPPASPSLSGFGGQALAGAAGTGAVFIGGKAAQSLIDSTAVKGLLGSGAGKAVTDTSAYIALKNGTVLAGSGGAAVQGLATAGTAFGSGAATVGGAAAAGAAGIGGVIGGVAGLVSSIVDLVQGVKKGKSGDKEGAKKEYVTAGTKAGMVGTGAGIGAAVGSIVPVIGTGVGALAGAGIGGIAALLGGNKLGEKISEWFKTDLKNSIDVEDAYETIVSTVKSSSAEAAGEMSKQFAKGSQSTTASFNEISSYYETVVDVSKQGSTDAANVISEQYGKGSQSASSSLDGVSSCFEAVTGSVTQNASSAGASISDAFSQSSGNAKSSWSGVSGWFSTNVWEPIKSGAGSAASWLYEKFQGVINWLFGNSDKGSGGSSDSTAKAPTTHHAWGGIMTSPHMGLVAEDGAEAIIPLSPSKNARGLDLWKKTGQMLGVRQYADGGVVGNIQEDNNMATAISSESRSLNNKLNIEVAVTPTFVIQGGDTDEGKIVSVLKEYIQTMVDDIGDELAERLAVVFSNMPVKGVV